MKIKLNKLCCRCGVYKKIIEFSKDNHLKDKLASCCKSCMRIKNNKNYNKHKEKYRLKRKNIPWKETLHNILQRCNNSNFIQYKNYGGRNIKCLITEIELRKLWFRDKAYEMKKPSIDRINNDGNYELKNCRFIELSENSAKDKRKKVLQYDLERNFIREWESVAGIERALKLSTGHIVRACNGIYKQSFGFIWEYKQC